MIPVIPPLTPPLDNVSLPIGPLDSSSITALDAGAKISETSTSLPTVVTGTTSRFPVQVSRLPNKGRCFIATRRIQPRELVFVAESYGANISDSWMDCGFCHFCWINIQNQKAQVRLPKDESAPSEQDGARSNKKPKQKTTMMFCDETCHQLYKPDMAQWICQIEQKIRRVWNESVSRHWKLRFPHRSSSAGLATEQAGTSPVAAVATLEHYSSLIQKAFRIAHTRQELLQLNDQDLTLFLNCIWGALDGLIEEQVSILTQNTATPPQQAQYEALIPKLMAYLLTDGKWGDIATKTSDGDCESIRMISEVLYLRELEQQRLAMDISSAPSLAATQETVDTSDGIVHGDPVAFADYCAMQSNELVLLRQQLKLDMENTDLKERIWTPESGSTTKSDHNRLMDQWRQLVSILPVHLLGCIYIYMRMRDAHLILTLENSSASATSSSSAIIPSIDNTLFRTVFYSEVANAFGIWDSSYEYLGGTIFPRAVFFNHSCRPNIDKKRRQGHKTRQMEFWSNTVIEAGEECCISYGDITVSRKERQESLETAYFFRCSCARCLEEEEAEHKH